MIEEEPKVRVCGVDGGPDVGVEFIDALAECLGARVDGSETREIVDEAVNSRSPSILQCRTPPLARRHVKQGVWRRACAPPLLLRPPQNETLHQRAAPVAVFS